MAAPLDTCTSCGSSPLRTFYELSGIPAQSCVLLPRRAEALAYPCGDLALGHCGSCGMISNTQFSEDVQGQAGPYEASQGFSQRFNEFLRQQCETLVERHGIQGKPVLEIGCGSGDFLTLLCEVGGNTGVGFDPEYRGPERAGPVRFISERFSEAHFATPAALIACRHTLEHVLQVGAFMRMVRGACRSPETLVFFEVPDAKRILEQQAFWDVYYEHCAYFSMGSLARLFRRSGFDIVELERVYGDQYLVITAKASSGSQLPLEQEADLEQVEAACRDFQVGVSAVLETWRARLANWQQKGARIALWGAGSKAAGFLATLKVREQVPYIVDINPRKQGMFQAGTGQQVVPPAALADYRPDTVVIMNQIYTEEIRAELKTMGLEPEIVAL